MRTEQQLSELQGEFMQGKVTRRQFTKMALALGMSLPGISAFLAACAGQPAPAQAPAPAAPKAAAPAAPAVPAGEQKLVIAGAKDISNLDPLQANDADSQFVYNQIHETLLRLDPKFDILPAIAESWSASPDGLTYTFKLRKGVKFHDGSEVKADDVIFTIERILANKFPEGRKKEKIEMIDSYKKIDDYTVEVKLKFAYAPFAAAMGAQHIVPKAVVEKMGDVEFGKKPIGAGPFKLVEWVTNDHVTLQGNPDYWLTRPNLATIVVRPIPENAVAVANLIAGDVDAITDVVGQNLKQIEAAASRGVQLLTKTGFSYFFAGFRMVGPPFTDLRFRQAVYHSTDFDATIKAIFPPQLATRAYGTVPSGLWPQDTEYLKGIALKPDMAKAKALFKQLMDEGVMAKDYKVIVAPPPDDARIRIAEIMLTNLKEAGVNAEMQRVDFPAYIPSQQWANQNVIYFLGTTPAVPDPDANVRWLFEKGGAHGRYLNIGHFKEDPEWEAQIKKAQMSTNRDERSQIYRDIVRTMMQQVVHIPLYNKNAIMAKRDYVKGLDVNVQFDWDIVRPWANVSIEGKK